MKNNHFLTLLVSFFSLFSIEALSVELPKGEYKFQGQLAAITHKITEVVHSGTAQGQGRLEQLKTEGYMCQHVYQQQVSCSIFSKDMEMPSDLSASIQDKYDGYTLDFGSIEGVELTNDSEYLTEYKVSQTVKTLGVEADGYQLSILKGGLHKMKIESKDQTLYFNYTNPKELQIVSAYKKSKGFVTHTYLVEINLN